MLFRSAIVVIFEHSYRVRELLLFVTSITYMYVICVLLYIFVLLFIYYHNLCAFMTGNLLTAQSQAGW